MPKSAEEILLQRKIIQRIKTLRENTGYTQAKFAEKNGIDRQLQYRWENINSEAGLSVYTIQRFCDMIGISLKEFFDDKSFKDK